MTNDIIRHYEDDFMVLFYLMEELRQMAILADHLFNVDDDDDDDNDDDNVQFGLMTMINKFQLSLSSTINTMDAFMQCFDSSFRLKPTMVCRWYAAVQATQKFAVHEYDPIRFIVSPVYFIYLFISLNYLFTYSYIHSFNSLYIYSIYSFIITMTENVQNKPAYFRWSIGSCLSTSSSSEKKDFC
jgi:hypothetical protein